MKIFAYLSKRAVKNYSVLIGNAVARFVKNVVDTLGYLLSYVASFFGEFERSFVFFGIVLNYFNSNPITSGLKSFSSINFKSSAI